MGRYYCICLLLVTVYSQTVQINPKISYKYISDAEQYSSENLAIQDYELILEGKYDHGSVSVLSRMGYHLIDGTLLYPNSFTSAQGAHWLPNDPGLGEQRNYYIADLLFTFGDSTSFIYLNKWDKDWGPGIHSLILSNKIPSFLHFGFKWKMKDNLNFEYFHGKLKSNIDDTVYANYYNYVGYNPIDINRNIVGHRLEWEPFKYFYLSASELIVYANRELELTYLLPFVPFFPLQSYIGETDNVIISIDMKYMPSEKLHVYGALVVDEWSPPFTFDKDNRNWFAWQAGFMLDNLFILESRFRLEYNWTDHRIYRHRYYVNDYYSWGYPVGFWAGPHAEEVYADYVFNCKGNMIELMFSFAKRGELTYDMLEDQYSRPDNSQPIYDRFSGQVEIKQKLSVTIHRNITKKLLIKSTYTYVNWKNAGFNPKSSSSDSQLPDILKNSFGFGITYKL